MSPELELQGAIFSALRADAVVASLVNDRIFDTVPRDAAFPYISFGPMDSVQEDADCVASLNIAIQIDGWSQEVGMPEVKAISDAVRAVLHDADLPLSVNALVLIEHRLSRHVRDPDGVTNHAIISFEAIVEQK